MIEADPSKNVPSLMIERSLSEEEEEEVKH